MDELTLGNSFKTLSTKDVMDCPSCGERMQHHKVNNIRRSLSPVHIFVCGGSCPNVLFEYHTIEDAQTLDLFLAHKDLEHTTYCAQCTTELGDVRYSHDDLYLDFCSKSCKEEHDREQNQEPR